MGFLDFFRKKTLHEKTMLELAKDRQFVQKIEDAVTLLSGLEGSISAFLDEIEKSAKQGKSPLLRNAIERHGFLMDIMQGRTWDAEKLAVYSNRQAKWAAIKKEADKTLDIIAAIRQMLKGKKTGIEETAELSILLRAQFIKLKEAISKNIYSLWESLRKYPELIDTNLLDKKFEKLRWTLGAELDIINRIIEQLIVAERSVA